MVYLVGCKEAAVFAEWLKQFDADIVEIDGESERWAEALALARNTDLFAPRRRLFLFKNLTSDQLGLLKKHAWLVQHDVVLWFRGKLLQKDKALVQAVFRGVKVREETLEDSEDAVRAFANGIGLHITPQLLRELTMTYTDKEYLRNELLKLKQYFGDKPVETKELAGLLQRQMEREEKLESLMNAIRERNKARAYFLLRKERLILTEPVKIMGFLNGLMAERGSRFAREETTQIITGLAALDLKLKQGLVDREAFFDEVFRIVFA